MDTARILLIVGIVVVAIIVIAFIVKAVGSGVDKVRVAVDKSGKYQAKKQEKLSKAQTEEDIAHFQKKHSSLVKNLVKEMREEGSTKSDAKLAAQIWEESIAKHIQNYKKCEELMSIHPELKKVDKENHTTYYIGVIISKVISKPGSLRELGNFLENYLTFLVHVSKRYQHIEELNKVSQSEEFTAKLAELFEAVQKICVKIESEYERLVMSDISEVKDNITLAEKLLDRPEIYSFKNIATDLNINEESVEE